MITVTPEAEAHSQRLNGCSFDSLNENQQRAILLLIELPGILAAEKREQRFCLSCGRAGSLKQCMDCRGDGGGQTYKPQRYAQSGV
jgi:hypothetical protein